MNHEVVNRREVKTKGRATDRKTGRQKQRERERGGRERETETERHTAKQTKRQRRTKCGQSGFRMESAECRGVRAECRKEATGLV